MKEGWRVPLHVSSILTFGIQILAPSLAFAQLSYPTLASRNCLHSILFPLHAVFLHLT